MTVSSRGGFSPDEIVSQDEYSPIVLLQRGFSGEVPVFCIPGAGANVVAFNDLVDSLGELQPVYGIQPRGMDGVLVPHCTVPAAADCYLKAIKHVVPDGPIHLLGHSFGGWVAFELAQKLRESGSPVASLTIVDSMPPSDANEIKEYSNSDVLAAFISILEQLADRSLNLSIGFLDSLDEPGKLKVLHERAVRAGLMSSRSDADALKGPLRTFASCMRTAYQPAFVYPEFVRIVLLSDQRCFNRNSWRVDEQRRLEGWRKYGSDLEFSRGPGNHMTVLKPPHVGAFVRWLRTGPSYAGSGNPVRECADFSSIHPLRVQ
jgi:arthrofactin-type cyclic lipopeptide synthetase C